jgi:hypothetical protein
LRILRKAGALYTQILMLTPSPGSKWYENTYTAGLAIQKVNGITIEPHIVDGNYVVASKLPRPWIKQLNLLAGYTYFFNPLRLLLSLVYSKSVIPFASDESRPPEEVQHYSRWQKLRRRAFLNVRAKLIDAGVQAFGMYGLFHTYRRTLGWAWHLLRGKIQYCSEAPASKIPLRNPSGGPASHALPSTEVAQQEQDVPETCKTTPQRKAA